MYSFRYQAFPQEIVLAPNSLDQLPALLQKYDWARALLVTSGSYRANGLVARVEGLLGESLVGVYDSVQPHVPERNVQELTGMARDRAADVLIAVGGGSAIGVAKWTSHALDKLIASPAQTGWPPLVPLLAIPTTYAGSEMTPVFGVTRLVNGTPLKQTVNDPAVVPRVVLYDPNLTLDLPRALTASTGINALAHCVEAVYSVSKNPLSTAAALLGAQRIVKVLPRCYENGQDLAARAEMLEGAWLAGASLANVAMALHHGVCHVLGGSAGVPHGLANAIVLPHAIRFNAEACALELAELGRAMGLEAGDDSTLARQVGEHTAVLAAGMGLPSRLREVGISPEALPGLAELAFANKTVQNNPRPVTREGLEQLLRDMY
jgi:maleylacetate reductase